MAALQDPGCAKKKRVSSRTQLEYCYRSQGGSAGVPERDTMVDQEDLGSNKKMNVTSQETKCYSRAPQDAVPARVVLYILSFTGFLTNFMMRTDINIAMVAMVVLAPPSSNVNSTLNSLVCYSYSPNTTSSEDDDAPTPSQEEGEFHWDATVQGAILSSFYWCYILSQVVGGVLTQKFGTKAVFGYSQLATAICSLFIPVAASIHYSLLIVLRSIQGIASVFRQGLTAKMILLTMHHVQLIH
ncbi:hypothetical protein J6590_007509 [Homalodisca vitripennis]|nr:hypothetical protein J6590_007509 [Homalodisca vitripennis]